MKLLCSAYNACMQKAIRVSLCTGLALTFLMLSYVPGDKVLRGDEWVPHSFTVEPGTIEVDVQAGTLASVPFEVRAGAGDYTYLTEYSILIPWAQEDHCATWDEEAGICTEYDYEGWAADNFLCAYLSVNEDGGVLQAPATLARTHTLSIHVPCVGTACTGDFADSMFPESLLGRELACDLTVGPPPRPTYLGPRRAFADTAEGVLRVRATVSAAGGAPTLALASTEPYMGSRGVVSSGPNPERGIADRDTFYFAVVYTDSSNRQPTNVTVRAVPSATPLRTTTLFMSKDSTAPEALRDGDYTNGEQYRAASTFPKGEYTYAFSANTSDTSLTLASHADGAPFTFRTGYSSVAFIPGFQATELVVPSGQWNRQRVWPPVVGDYEQQLLFKEDGRPRDDDTVYATDIVRSVAGVDMYGDFADFMDTLVEAGAIASWGALRYDWRYDVQEVARMEVPVAGGGTYRLRDAVAAIAERSDSGRVTLLAHSNGGLVAKALVDVLAQEEKDALVDQMIMVAVPHYGTPKAVASILHGEGQGIPASYGPLINNADARSIARTLPGAYGLLPSAAYLNKVAAPTITFSDGALQATERTRFGEAIETFGELQAYMEGAYRARPDTQDTLRPEQAIPSLLRGAEAAHQSLDEWQAPEHVRLTNIVGWGLDTIQGIRYVTRTQTICERNWYFKRVSCGQLLTPDYEPVFTTEGDGTVVWASADTGRSYYVNLFTYQKQATGLGPGHAEIMRTAPVKQTIELLLKSIALNAQLPPRVFSNKPQPSNANTALRIRVLSPVEVTVVDEEGRAVSSNADVTGEAPIPGGYAMRFGEGKYLGVPADGTYSIALEGTATGTFTFIMEKVQNDEAHVLLSVHDIPVTPTLRASTTVASGTVSALRVDTNGDGTVDLNLGMQREMSMAEYLDVLAALSMRLPHKERKGFEAHLKTLRMLAERRHTRAFKILLQVTERYVELLVARGTVSTEEGATYIQVITHINNKV